MVIKVDKQKVYDFLKKNSLCVLSTASKSGKPESAVLGYAFKDDCFYFCTGIATRKYKNMV